MRFSLVADNPSSSPNQPRHGNNFNCGNRRNNNNKSRGRNNFNNRNQQNNWNPNMYWPSPFQKWQQPPYWGPFMPQNQNTRGVLGPRPVTNQQANLTFNAPQLTTDFAHAFNTMQLADPSAADWYMDSGATSHMAANQGILKSGIIKDVNHSVIVGNGSRIPVISSGNTFLNTFSSNAS